MDENTRRSEAFQSFLSYKTTFSGKPGVDTQIPWHEIEQRVRTKCIGKDNSFLEVALALAKYDYNGAPSNWEVQFKHEETIYDWCEWVIENYKKDEYSNLVKDYKAGYIPDAFEYMTEYFD